MIDVNKSHGSSVQKGAAAAAAAASSKMPPIQQTVHGKHPMLESSMDHVQLSSALQQPYQDGNNSQVHIGSAASGVRPSGDDTESGRRVQRT